LGYRDIMKMIEIIVEEDKVDKGISKFKDKKVSMKGVWVVWMGVGKVKDMDK